MQALAAIPREARGFEDLGARAAIPIEARRFEDLGALAAIPLETRRFEDLARYQFEAMIERVRAAEQHAVELLDGRTVWMVNSTAAGGGVAQLLSRVSDLRK